VAVRVEATAVLAVRRAAACVVVLPRRRAEAMAVVLAARCVVRQKLVRLLNLEESLLALRVTQDSG
jgi:hypothetical protein